ncbi:MAG TPA: tetratricopeptide repeat protein [Chloroflexota bacterium]|nr:tetratricopeptide repeat protein [Chloroflexota bacterium]
MAMLESEERARIKRVKAEQAVNLAMQSRWTEAAELNRQIIDAYPKDVEAHNRLGKALMELQKYDEAREVYNHALRLDPTNGIAHKNLLRLEKLMEESVAPGAPSAPVDPSLFIAETGRTTTTALVQLAAPEVLAKMDSGDPVDLRVEGNTVLAVSKSGDVLGKIEPKLRQRLIRLFTMGNEYAAVVTAVDEGSLKIIIRETHRDPSMGNRPSFPTTGEAFRGYVRDTLLRYELDEEEEEEEEIEEAEPDREPEMVAHDVSLDDVRDLAPDEEEEEP